MQAPIPRGISALGRKAAGRLTSLGRMTGPAKAGTIPRVRPVAVACLLVQPASCDVVQVDRQIDRRCVTTAKDGGILPKTVQRKRNGLD